MGDLRLALYPRLPESAAETTPREGAFLNDAYVERWTVQRPTGFAGETIAIDGLAREPHRRARAHREAERRSQHGAR